MSLKKLSIIISIFITIISTTLGLVLHFVVFSSSKQNNQIHNQQNNKDQNNDQHQDNKDQNNNQHHEYKKPEVYNISSTMEDLGTELGINEIDDLYKNHIDAIKNVADFYQPNISNKMDITLIDDSKASWASYEVKSNRIILKGTSETMILKAFNNFIFNNGYGIVSIVNSNISIPNLLNDENENKITFNNDLHMVGSVPAAGYDQTWYSFDEWKSFINWMAMNGYNSFYNKTGYEWVYIQTLKYLGMPINEIINYMTGPSYSPWFIMLNFSSYDQNKYAENFYRKKMEINKKIISYSKSLGMKIVASGFSGTVPPTLTKIKLFSKSTLKTTSWRSMGWENNPAYIFDIFDQNFIYFGKLFTRMYEHIFGSQFAFNSDMLNETDFSIIGTKNSYTIKDFLSRSGFALSNSIKGASNNGIWAPQLWMLTSNSIDNDVPYRTISWNKDMFKWWMQDISKKEVLLLDTSETFYYQKHSKFLYKIFDNFLGYNFVFGNLDLNFGGNNISYGQLTNRIEFFKMMSNDKPDNLIGVGNFSESFENNNFILDLESYVEMSNINFDEWKVKYFTNKFGEWNESINSYINKYISLHKDDKVFGVLISMIGFNQYTMDGRYNIGKQSIEKNYEEINSFKIAYDSLKVKTDFVNQNLIYYSSLKIATDISKQLSTIYESRIPATEQEVNNLKTQYDKANKLLASHKIFNNKRINMMIKKLSDTIEEENYYKKDWFRLLTFWGNGVEGYTARLWSDIFGTYYKDICIKRATNPNGFDRDSFVNELIDKYSILPPTSEYSNPIAEALKCF